MGWNRFWAWFTVCVIAMGVAASVLMALANL